MTELLSMALKGGKQERRVIRTVLEGKLWAGNVADAITYLRGLNPRYIKNPEHDLFQVELQNPHYSDRKSIFSPIEIFIFFRPKIDVFSDLM